MAFRPVHLIYLLVVMIVLESVVLYLKHPEMQETVDSLLHRGRLPEHKHKHGDGDGGRHHGVGGQAGVDGVGSGGSVASGHELHMHGEHPTVGLHVGKREPGAPRLAIVTLGHLTPQKRSAPSNVKAYANHWKYDLVDASKTVSTAAKALRAGKGDHSFLRGRWVGGWVGGLLGTLALHATRNLPYTLILRPYCCVSLSFFHSVCDSTVPAAVRLGLLARRRLALPQLQPLAGLVPRRQVRYGAHCSSLQQ
jgi:hypothetical protein